jgi:predicted MFS family arabinose efflux permease
MARRATAAPAHIWYVLAILTLANLVSYLDRTVLAVLLPRIKRSLALTDMQLGLLSGLAFAVFFSMFAVPIARLADRSSHRRAIVGVALALWSVMTALCGAARDFTTLMLARIGVGVGEAGSLPPSHSIISDYFPIERRSAAIAVHTSGAMAGSFLGLALGGWLGELVGWRLTFVILGVPGLILAAVLFLTVSEPPRGLADGHGATDRLVPFKQVPFKEALAYLVRCRSFVHLIGAASFAAFANFGLVQWLPSFYDRSYGLGLGQIGLIFGALYGAGAAIGTLGGGYLADKGAARDVRWGLWIGAVASLLATLAWCAMFLVRDAMAAFVLNFVAAILSSAYNAPTMAMVQSVAPLRVRATAASVMMLGGALIGYGAGPFLVGLLSDLLAPAHGGDSLRLALLLMSLATVLPALHLWRASRTLAADVRRAGEAREAPRRAPDPAVDSAAAQT